LFRTKVSQFMLALSGLVCVMVSGQATGATVLPGPVFPSYETAAALDEQCGRDLAQAAKQRRAMEAVPPGANWLGAFDDFQAGLEDAYGPILFVANVHPDKAIRDAAEGCELRWQTFLTDLEQSVSLYRAARATPPADDIDRKALHDLVAMFEDSGVSLPATERARVKRLSERIARHAQQFDRNIREDATRLPFTAAQLTGVPEHVWAGQPRDAEGRYLLGLDYPTYFPVMEQAALPSTRATMYRAKTNEGGQANLDLLAKIVRLRHEIAATFGYASYDDYVLRRRMAGSRARVDQFLAEVREAVAPNEARDLEVMKNAKAQQLHLDPAATSLDRSDVGFYVEQVRRQRYQVDQEAFRPYFPPQASLDFVMKLAETLFGVRYERVDARLWHAEVQAYAVSDAVTGRPLATLYIDLYPRPGKYNHAAVWSFRSGAQRHDRKPQAALVVNFDRRGLTLDELETLLHEFGHSLHSNLSNTRYAMQAGTQVERDFVEAPSQMLEDWVYDKPTLKLFAQVCPACEPVPDDLVDRARAARDFGKGARYARQQLYAGYDIALHGDRVQDPMQLWKAMESRTSLGYMPGTKFPAGFGHIASGYAAGYYGYLWSLVVATDLRSAFDGGHRLDAAVGRRYRDEVIGQGGQRPPDVLIRNFLGRPMSPDAFFADLRR